MNPRVDKLNDVCDALSFSAERVCIRIETPFVYPHSTHKEVYKIVQSAQANDLNIVATMVPYDDNFFFHGWSSLYVVSFHGWNQLTNLPIANGFIYFLAGIITDRLGTSFRHDRNTGCLNDFLEDKTGVDIGMRSAYLCPSCRAAVESHQGVGENEFSDLLSILDLLSTSSRSNIDFTQLDTRRFSSTADVFDIFLCHNSQDKAEIRRVNSELIRLGVKTWLDEEQLPLGVPWQDELEKQISAIRNAAVFVGSSGIGPWQNNEIRSFLEEFVTRACPVIPVILPGTSGSPELPRFLRQMTWVDLRSEYERKIERLANSLLN